MLKTVKSNVFSELDSSSVESESELDPGFTKIISNEQRLLKKEAERTEIREQILTNKRKGPSNNENRSSNIQSSISQFINQTKTGQSKITQDNINLNEYSKIEEEGKAAVSKNE